MWWFECSRSSFFKCFLRSATCLCDAYTFLEFPLSCPLKMCATAGACIGLFSSAAVAPQSKSTELRSSAAVVPQSKSTELCSSAAVVPHKGNQSSCVVGRRPLCHTPFKSTAMWSSAGRFHHDLWYFRHRTNEYFSSMLFIRKKNLYTSLK